MKKVIGIIVAVFLLTANFSLAQTDKKVVAKPAMENKMTTHCYAMKEGAMVHCMGSKGEPMTKDASLKNGATVSTKGEVTTKEGQKTKLMDGQCVLMDGTIGDYDKMHPSMKK